MYKRNDVFPVIPFRHQNELRDVNVNAREDSLFENVVPGSTIDKKISFASKSMVVFKSSSWSSRYCMVISTLYADTDFSSPALSLAARDMLVFAYL